MKTFVAITVALLVSPVLLAADGVLPAGTYDKTLMTRQAYEAHGEYLRETETRRHIPHIVYYMSVVAKKQGRTPLEMAKIFYLAEGLDLWFKSYGVEMVCVRMYWQGLDDARRPLTLDTAALNQIVEYWSQHESFFRMVFANRCREQFMYDFVGDLRAAVKG